MDLSNLNPNYTPISDSEIAFLDSVAKSKNKENIVQKIDVTKLYMAEFSGSKNEDAYCTPYTLLRLLVDLVPNMPDKLLYLDIDMMICGDLNELYSLDASDVEYLAVKEKYGSKLLYLDYINAGMLLFNMKLCKENHLFEKARDFIRNKKLMFADQDAIYMATTKKALINRKYNEQSKFNKKETIVCHFCKRLLLWPWFKVVNIKQWHIDDVHKYYKCHRFDDDLNEYITLKEKYTRSEKI